MKGECQGLLLTEGAKGAALWGLGSIGVMALHKRLTPMGRRLSLHPYSIVATISVVASFWIYGETSVTQCQRAAFDRRKSNIGKNHESEIWNRS